MKIAVSSKIWKLLTANLYADLWSSTLRELSCNAKDSLIMCGRPDVPFKVILPNKLCPHLVVADTGLGLSQDEIDNLFMVLGESNKTTSNSTTGCFGIGGKVAWSASSAFVIISRKDGFESVYSAHLDEDELPVISLVGKKETTETGLEIKIPIKESDFHRIGEAAVKVLSWFTPRPIVTGNPSFKFFEPSAIISGPDYIVSKEWLGKSKLIMGAVEYDISQYDSQVPYEHRNIMEHGVYLFVPIGSVEVSSSRESLVYSEKTRQCIKEMVAKIMQECKVQVETSFSGAKSPWEVRKLLKNWGGSVLHNLVKMSTYEFNGKKLTPHIDMAAVRNDYTSPLFGGLDINITHKGGMSKHKSSSFDPHDNLIVNDLAFGGYARTKEYLESAGKSNAVLLNDVPTTFFADEGIPLTEIVYTSKLPVPPRKPRVKREGSTAKVFKFQSGSGDYNQSYWLETEVDLTEGGIFVQINRYNWMRKSGNNTRPAELQKMSKQVEKLTGQIIEIYGIKNAFTEKATSQGEWVNFEDYLDKLLVEHQEVLEGRISERIRNSDRFKELLIFNGGIYEFEQQYPESLIVKFLERYRGLVIEVDTVKLNAYQTISNYLGKVGISIDVDTPYNELVNLFEKAMDAYPMLKHCSLYRSDLTDFINYVRLVENSKTSEPKQSFYEEAPYEAGLTACLV